MKRVKVLVAQYKTRYLNIRANLMKFGRILKKYSYLTPDLVIFPEYALTGPLYSNYHLAFNNNSILGELSTMAQKYRVSLIPGSFIRKVNSKLLNSSCFINSKGRIAGFYDKENLWSSEKRYLTKGDVNNIFKTTFGNIALQICADLSSSSLSAEYRKLKPDLIVNIAMWSHEDIKACIKYVPSNIELIQTELLTKTRALENKCYMIFCNFGGSLQIEAKTGRRYHETSIGSSMIINPFGEIVAKTNTNKEEVIFAEMDLSQCHWSRSNY